MTLPYSPSIAKFTGNGLVKEFPFNFKVWDSSQLVVSVSRPDGLVENIHFTVELGEHGGTVTALYNNAPVPQGYTLSIVRNMPFEQDVDLVSGTRFDPQVIEDQLDKAAAERQQLREGLERAVIVAPGSDETPMMIVGKIFVARDTAVSFANGAAQSAADAAEYLDKAIVEHITALEEIHALKTSAVEEVNTHGKEQQALCTAQVLVATEQAVQASASAQSATESARKAAEIAYKGQPSATQDIQGIVRLSDSITATSGVDGGISATPKAVNDVKKIADTAQDTANIAQNAANAAQETANDAILAAKHGFIAGGIVPFSGGFGGSDGKRPIPRAKTDADEGWVLCDGTNGTPDLRGRFIIGGGGAYDAGNVGGAATHTHNVTGSSSATTLSVAQMPSHGHGTNAVYSSIGGNATSSVEFSYWGPNFNGASVYGAGSSGAHSHTMTLQSATGGGLPPYYALSYIMKL